MWVQRVVMIGLLLSISSYAVITSSAAASFIAVVLLLWITTVFLYQHTVLKGLHVKRYVGAEHITQGEKIEVVNEVAYRSVFPLLWLLIEEKWYCQQQQETKTKHTLVTPFWNRKGTYRYDLHDLPRGVYRSSSVCFITGDLFGVWKKRYSIQREVAFVVYPKPTMSSWSESKVISQGYQATRDYYADRSLRNYEQGMPLKFMNWKQTAKTGDLKVNAFHAQEQGKTVILLDTELQQPQDREAFEHSIQIATSFLTKHHALHRHVYLKYWQNHNTQQCEVKPSHDIEPALHMLALAIPERDANDSEWPSLQIGRSSVIVIGTSIQHKWVVMAAQYAGITIRFVVVTNRRELTSQEKEVKRQLEQLHAKVEMVTHKQMKPLREEFYDVGA
ncbi:DUF58 domain-containing protein [Longirhabdus pacifica]|uniref:DUF58 domain-containing protein n=1 Tax=Longirhabdus pacifica TaxID=2305227 RepID=UPI0013E8EE0B|nr:DUF58 domain-containing protein [Longirhabdus pacifica]